MSIDRHLQEKIYRLETLRKYQAYYGPNTPYQIIAEINQLEGDLRRMLKADVTRPTQSVRQTPAAQSAKKPKARPKAKPKPKPKTKTRATAKVNNKAGLKKKKSGSAAKKKAPAKKSSFWKMSQATTDLVATIAFIGMVFFLGAIVFAAYLQTRPANNNAALAQSNPPAGGSSGIVLRPTFTPTPNSNDPLPEDVAPAEAVSPGDSLLPPAERQPTAVPTPVPTLTPSPVPEPTNTPLPPPTNTPAPTQPPPPAPPPAQPPPQSAPAAEPASVEPAAPPPPPAPSFPYTVAEQGNRMFQHTDYHVITVYVALVSEGNLPIGGLKVVGDHTPSGRHVESALSDWHWSVTNCLDCDYVKFGNVKFEPGVFEDGTWSIYVADEQGNELSEAMPLTYSADPADWVWDFIIFKRNG